MDAFWQFVRGMWRRRRSGLIVALLFAFLSAGGLGAGLVSLAPMMKIILNPEDPTSLAELAQRHNANPQHWITIPTWIVDQLPTEPYHGVLMVMAGIAILTILGACASFLHQYLSQTITTNVVAEVRRDVFDVVLHMPLARVVQRGPSEFVARIIRDVAELQRGLIALVSKSVSQVTKGLAAFATAVFFEWRLTLIAAVVAPILAIALRKLGKRIRRGTRGSLRAQEKLLGVASESLQGLRSVKANTAEPFAQRRFDRSNEDVVHHELRIRTARALSAPLVETLAVFAIIALALIAAKSILSGSLPLDRFVLALGALGVAGGSFRPLAGLVNEMQAASAPAQRLSEILGEPRETPDDAKRAALKPIRNSIRFDAVSYTYPGADAPALRDISLDIACGQRIALVGPNGSGKTTLASLLPRLLVPQTGRVLIDDTDLADVSLQSVRRQIGVVAQETVLIRGTIAENIAFGMEDATPEAIADAAKRARADTFIADLPNGYDTDLAEHGASLSGGQRQRIAIARAILRDPSVLILDEATSQIDAESEAQINDALREFCDGRTAIVIAHRLSTVVNADRIVVMSDGRIKDVGAHDALQQRCELYRRLTKTQLVAAS